MIIRGREVLIRAIEEDDLTVLMNSINDPELERFENGFNFPLGMMDQRKWFESLHNNEISQKMIIEYEGIAIGWISLVNVDWKNGCAHTGIKLFSTEFRGKGLAQDAVMAIMRFAFNELNLNRLEGFILDYNIASQKLYIERCGWKVEGKKRKAVFKNGGYHDLIMVGILKEEYEELVKENNYWDV